MHSNTLHNTARYKDTSPTSCPFPTICRLLHHIIQRSHAESLRNHPSTTSVVLASNHLQHDPQCSRAQIEKCTSNHIPFVRDRLLEQYGNSVVSTSDLLLCTVQYSTSIKQLHLFQLPIPSHQRPPHYIAPTDIPILIAISTPASNMKRTFTIAFALCLVSLAFGSGCFSGCRFRFCDGTTKFNPNAYAPNTPFNGRLCDKTGTILLGTVDQSGEAWIQSPTYFPGSTLPISNFAPDGLMQNFSPSFFKTFAVDGGKYSSVGAETSQQGQIEFLRNACVILPFRKYQVLDQNTQNVIENVNTSNTFVDCVAFEVHLG